MELFISSAILAYTVVITMVGNGNFLIVIIGCGAAYNTWKCFNDK